MTNYLIINMHWYNRGDEAANRALIDELRIRDDGCKINVQIASEYKASEVNLGDGVEVLQSRFPEKKDLLEYLLIYITKGKVAYTTEGKNFSDKFQNADIIVHAPGGPSIGEVYRFAERPYLLRLLFAKHLKKKYVFFAPSMGPFRNKKRNIIRKYILDNASLITLRESVSAGYLKSLLPNCKYEVTLDSAFQHPVDMQYNKQIYETYGQLKKFINSHEKVIGITITDLMWNPKYLNNYNMKAVINDSFKKFIDYLLEEKYGVIFIPQLFGADNDKDYMTKFSINNHCFVMEDTYDCYFQQYVISRLHVVVGMRYHSNIFACKMKIPFLSVVYEQKMKGFMEDNNLTCYCIDVDNLSSSLLIEKFELIEKDYLKYKGDLEKINSKLVIKSRRTTDLLLNITKKDRGIL